MIPIHANPATSPTPGMSTSATPTITAGCRVTSQRIGSALATTIHPTNQPTSFTVLANMARSDERTLNRASVSSSRLAAENPTGRALDHQVSGSQSTARMIVVLPLGTVSTSGSSNARWSAVATTSRTFGARCGSICSARRIVRSPELRNERMASSRASSVMAVASSGSSSSVLRQALSRISRYSGSVYRKPMIR
ncbi:Uncharacterised protein [Mycobacteroides abscessus subsp. abscessus]|nr:Uncharacterised protein [Mycobacteroides abscessus subsp. abscessus]